MSDYFFTKTTFFFSLNLLFLVLSWPLIVRTFPTSPLLKLFTHLNTSIRSVLLYTSPVSVISKILVSFHKNYKSLPSCWSSFYNTRTKTALHSRWGLTNKYNLGITSTLLLLVLLATNRNTLLGRFLATIHCFLELMSELTCTPKSFSHSDLFNITLRKLYLLRIFPSKLNINYSTLVNIEIYLPLDHPLV